jgi:SAM-dependent methyltransferase
MNETTTELQRIYRRRFEGNLEYRAAVWRVLVSDFFSRYIRPSDRVLDLGCGYGQFINQVRCGQRYAMDLNPSSRSNLETGVVFFEQDCAERWAVEEDSLDLVFTSNFFEHLSTKSHLLRTLEEAYKCLRKGGRLIALGPNIKYVPGAYWDFFDHHIALTELSLQEAMELVGFDCLQVTDRFLPFTMVNAPRYPLLFLSLYLKLPWLWRWFGRQFLVIAQKG